ncbi:MAG: YkgJ family cysteine cluster protein [Simkaniaceae bacterium]|nr:YkgJ family cysteine cluster protein [Simkaniaceae bacterium]
MHKKRQGHLNIYQENVDDLLNHAGLATEQPLPPQRGIDRQWLPKGIRKFIQWICLPLVLMDLAAQKIARLIIRPPFKQVGQCKRRGNCCHYIMMKKSRFPFHMIERFWAVQINGFYFRHDEPVHYDGREVHIMGCRHLKKNGSCNNYRLRPLVCRRWPVIEHFGYPKTLKGCGYQLRLRKGKSTEME